MPEILDAILQAFPLDTYTDKPVQLMELMDCDKGKIATPILCVEKVVESG